MITTTTAPAAEAATVAAAAVEAAGFTFDVHSSYETASKFYGFSVESATP